MPLRAFESILEPAGPQAASIAWLWWVMFATTAAVFVVVVIAVIAAVIRGRIRAKRQTAPTDDSLLTTVVGGAVAVTIFILTGLLLATMWTTRTTLSLGAASAVSISIVGHQWWWEIEYEDSTPSRRVKTANEIHIPVGRPVVFKVASRDVIHSFWVPNLQGKRDLVPGISTAIWLQADRPGIYRGQCAEFCGRQHAHMAFDVVAESEAEFSKWLDAQRAPAREPETEASSRGRTVFMSSQCVLCHTIRGTAAAGNVGPDLTHLASRATLAAATLPNSRGHLAGWIVDPQSIKPGNQMPRNVVAADDLQALLTYLEGLR